MQKINENLDSQIALKDENQNSVESKTEPTLIEQDDKEILNVKSLIQNKN